ncbi:hypothetical protein [Marinoscillum pacificum]|uniref:hypothetical protein n=1 Tax=Marinoscillum pacificum TaxID=392723 RepID=UPI002157D380|nr:hypothetical protein [Marinoscillum pacificum]
MNITSENIDVRSDHYYGTSSIFFKIKGYLSTYSCGIAAKAWKDKASENHEKHLLVLDLTKMVGHESSSRQLLANTIASTSRRVKAVVIISDSLLHRLYLRLLLRSVSSPVIIHKSENQLSVIRAQLMAS